LGLKILEAALLQNTKIEFRTERKAR